MMMPQCHKSFLPSEGQAGDTGSNLLRSVMLGRKKHCFCRAFSFFAAIPAFAASQERGGRTDGVMPEAQNASPSRIPARGRGGPCRRTALARWKYSQKPAILPTDKERLRKAGDMYYYETF